MRHYIFLLFLCCSLNVKAQAVQPNEKAQALLDDITKIYMSSMVYIFQQQPLINGNEQDKSALFGDNLIANIQDVYIKKYNEPFPLLDHETKKLLVQTMVDVMDDNRALIQDPELEFKGIIPAVFAFQLSAQLSVKGVGLKIKFTRTSDDIRNVLNKPDQWESNVMSEIIDNPKIYYDANGTLNGKPAYRQFTPLPMAPYCLQCHGEPKHNPLNYGKPQKAWTTIDMTGFEMENWALTDFGGGASLVG